MMFKRIALGLASLAVAVAPLATLKVRAAQPNLLANPSVESADSAGNPANWHADKWGSNSTNMTYQNGGHSGSKSLYINMSARTSGDAKWMHDAVSVKPNTSYTFTDYYQSSTATELDAQYTDTNGIVSYVYLKTAPASNSWTQATSTFTTPSNVSKVVIMHIIYSTGWLQTDDYSLIDNTITTVNTPPTVNFTSPADGATVSGAVNLSANAIDDQSVAGVQFRVDGSNIGGEDTSGPYSQSWDTTTISNGSHTLSAIARDNSGLTATATLTVNVQNTATPTPPTISLTSPAADSTITGTVNINANASDAKGISSVQFKLDGINLGSPDTAAPYTYNWDTTTVQNGNHTLTATATNTSNLTTTSAAVAVNVQNQVTPPPASGNLIANPSVESADTAGNPANWHSDKWGTNTTTMSYQNGGHSGSKSLYINMSARTSGDAKWMHDAVSVTPGQTYVYSDYYKSSVATELDIQYISSTGAVTYGYLGSAATSSTNWAQTSTSFTVPSGVTKVVIIHIIYSAGWLQTDDYSLTQFVTPPQTGLIPNSSLEFASPTSTQLPADWTSSKWGNNTAKFEYINNDGHTGNHSVKVTVSKYTDGDAKWYFNPITSLTPGSQYRFTTWYKTNTIPHAVAMFLDAQGNEHFFGMPNPQPNGSTTQWQKYTETFDVPSYAVATTAFLFIPNNGWVQVDDQSIDSYTPVGFNRPLVTLTFDDGYEENVSTVLPVLDQYGFKSTQCYETQDIEGVPGAADMVLNFYNDGHEICAHTVTHPFLTTLSTSQVDYELSHSQQVLQNIIGAPVKDFASPYGDYNQAVNVEIAKYFQSHRTVDEGYNSKDNFDIYRLRVQNMTPDTTIEEFQYWLDKAKATNTWLILVYHRVTNGTPEAFDSTKPQFDQQMQVLNQSGITVKTMNDALAEVKSQL